MNSMKFNKFKKLTKTPLAIEEFEPQYGAMLDVPGVTPAWYIGFYFHTLDEAGLANTRKLLKTFKPMVVWCGNWVMLGQVYKMDYGHKATQFSWFEGSRFAVVLKIPVNVGYTK